MGGHTPGPWLVGKRFKLGEAPKTNVFPIHAPQDGCASCGSGAGQWLVAWVHKESNPSPEANARLISAAPELLYVARLVTELADVLGENNAVVQLARAAILKAEGDGEAGGVGRG